MLEGYTTLGFLAAHTTAPDLQLLVTGVTYRHPGLLAKIVSTLDVLSGGRAVLGLGAAWYEREHRGLGVPFPPLAERFERLEEALQICRAMFREESATFEGRHYCIREALNYPRPVRPGGPPILVGGMGEQKTLRLVARYADACNLFGPPALVRQKLDVLERHCAEIGRDPSEITKTRLGTLVIAASQEAAEEKARLLAERRGAADWVARAVVGGPVKVAETVAAFLDAGLDGLIFNLPDADNLETVKLAGHVLCDALGIKAL